MRRKRTNLTSTVFVVVAILCWLSAGCHGDDHGRGPDYDHHPDIHGHVDVDHNDIHDQDHH